MTRARDRKKELPSLSKAEWEIMKTFWDHGKQAARDVFAALPEGHGWAIKTVKTLLSRLVAKGALEYEQIGNSYLYRPVFTREQLTREEMKGFVDRVLDGSLSPVLMHFAEETDLSDEEIAEIRKVLDKKGNRSRGEKKR